MGLDCSYGAWSGGYSSFDLYRQALCEAIGGRWDSRSTETMYWYWGAGYSASTHPGLYAFFNHSDCSGELTPTECRSLSEELKPIVSIMSAMGSGPPHIERQGGYAGVTENWIKACTQAAEEGEPILFR